MATKTRTKKPPVRRKSAAKTPTGELPAKFRAPMTAEEMAIERQAMADEASRRLDLALPIEAIQPGPFNPRKEFPKAELEELAATIKSHGVLAPILVRPSPGFVGVRRARKPTYQLVAGERRLRAAKLAGLKTVPAIVWNWSDQEAREISLIENWQRKDLNAIERARGLKAALEGEEAPTQTELAERLGCTQGHISNQLRVLGLPEKFRKRIISGQIPPRHARAIARYKDCPVILQEIDKEVDSELKYSGSLLVIEEFEDAILDAVNQVTEPMDGKPYEGKLGRPLPVFKPSDEERAKLGVITVDDNGCEEERATNIKLWWQLRNRQIKELAEKSKAKAAGKDAKSKPAARKLTAAQQKAKAADQKALARQQAEQERRWLWEWKIDWLKYEISRSIPEAESLAVGQIELYLLAIGGHTLRSQNLVKSLKLGRLKVSGPRWAPDFVPAIGGLENAEQLEAIVRDLLPGCFWDQRDGPISMIERSHIPPIADLLCIDLAACWRDHQAGPLSKAYWNQKTKEELVKLAGELKVKLPAGDKKADLVEALQKPGKVTAMPKEIAKIKPPR